MADYKLHLGFQLHGGSMPLTSTLFQGQVMCVQYAHVYICIMQYIIAFHNTIFSLLKFKVGVILIYLKNFDLSYLHFLNFLNKF